MAQQQHTSLAPVHSFVAGNFGKAGGQYLKSFRNDIIETVVTDDTIPLPEVWPASRALVLIGWRPAPNLCSLLEELSYKWERPFIPLFLDSTVMRLGPVVIPGHGACWNCWIQRSQQHADWPEAEAALLDHYGHSPASGPHGYLEPFAMMAAARLSEVIDQLTEPEKIGGHIWQLDMLTQHVTLSQIVGIHGCPRCGLHRSPEERTFAPLEKELAYLWADPVQER
jgi:bacteriocin biosynthesis cyclodehydratase domain-containing protein